MNIALVSDCYYPTKNGVTGVVALLKQELEKRGHRVLLIAPFFGSPPPEADGFPPVDVILPSFPLFPSIELRLVFASRQYLVALFLKEGIEMVHTHTEGPAGCAARAAALRLNIPMVHTLHTLYRHYLHYLPFPLSKLAFMQFLADRVMGAFLSPFDTVIAPSVSARQYTSDVAPSVPVYLLPNARFSAGGVNAGGEPRKGTGGFMILVVGRIGREKRSCELFEAFAPLLAGRREITLLFAGGGSHLRSLRRRAKAAGLEDQMLFPGYLPHREVLSLYEKADLLVSFSLSENHPLSFLEAAAAKLPLAVRSCPAYEGFVEDGVSGIVAGSDRELAEQVVMLLGDAEKLQILREGASRLGARFSADLHLERSTQLYNELRLDAVPIHG